MLPHNSVMYYYCHVAQSLRDFLKDTEYQIQIHADDLCSNRSQAVRLTLKKKNQR